MILFHLTKKRIIKLLDKYLINDKSNYFLLYGKMNKKEKKYEKARNFFEKSIKEGNSESMYQYGKMYIKGQGIEKNEKEGIKFIKMSISYGFVRASCEYGLYLMNRNQGNGW